jgi:hypothetical protein
MFLSQKRKNKDSFKAETPGIKTNHHGSPRPGIYHQDR